jgi:hypothetical protein
LDTESELGQDLVRDFDENRNLWTQYIENDILFTKRSHYEKKSMYEMRNRKNTREFMERKHLLQTLLRNMETREQT